MCGICGFYSKRAERIDDLVRMNDTMVHRGPDDHGEELYELHKSYSVGFGHRRLSIIDLSDCGHQPMHSIDGRVSIVFNGEIYNYRNLKKELVDYPFQSNCDTEIIIAAYLKWGISCVDKFNGMFALALLDRADDSLYLVRDRIGKKPLYYYRRDDNLYFASELKPIMKINGFSKEIAVDILGNYLHHMCVPTPYSIFKNVFKLSPGSILKFRYGELTIWKYWDISERYHYYAEDRITDFQIAKDELKKKLEGAVKERMIADVPVGAFLSGGYDSSLICAMAQKLTGRALKTYCIGFEQEELNEAGHARKIAEYLGTDHTELYISDKDMYDLLEDLPHYYDEPFADSSQIATMLVAKLAKKDVSVVLSGDGGDELFGGYNIYSKLQQAQKKDLEGAWIYYIRKMPLLGKRCFQNRTLLQRMVSDSRKRDIKTQIGVNNYIEIIRQILLREGISYYYPIESKYQVKEWDMRRMLLDMETYLPNDILCKVDRASMKYSLECRCPILDKNVMEYSFRLPQSMKDDRGNQKKILKSIAYDYIPASFLDRPKKGFGVPIDFWMRNQLREQLESYVEMNFLKRQGIFHAYNVRKLVLSYIREGDKGKDSGANYSKIIWPYFIFQQWYVHYFNHDKE